MYNVEWIGKDETPGPFGGWIKILSYEQIALFCKETIEAGGIILRITKAQGINEMQKLNINCSIVEVTKNEGKEVQRLKALIEHNREQAERSADIWMRSAPDDKAAARRKAFICV